MFMKIKPVQNALVQGNVNNKCIIVLAGFCTRLNSPAKIAEIQYQLTICQPVYIHFYI